MRIRRFEDLECWKASRRLVILVYAAVRNNPDFRKDFRLSGQITGAAISAMSNTAEGFSRRSGKEFVQFLFIAKSSATEVQSEAYAALDQKYIDQDSFDAIYTQADEVSRLCSGLITYLLRPRKKPLQTQSTRQTQQTQ